jgi:hypothetical protein
MSFLEPLLLAGLPLAALPIIIHLINQRRFQNVDWAAMRFLLEANRMSRGYARIRQWLILLFRTLAVGALIVTIARPLARGTLGLVGGGRADTTLILLDRSASMNQRGTASVSSKLDTGVQQLAQTLATLGSSQWALIDSVSLKPQELESPQALVQAAAATGTSAAADLPSLLRAAHDYLRANRSGQTEVWICSDLRASDWNASSSQWTTLRDAFRELPQGVRFHLLAYPDQPEGNVAVRVSDVRRQESAGGASLLVSLALARTGGAERIDVPVQLEIEGARSEIVVGMEGSEFALQDHAVPIEADKMAGWGRVSIPADVNPADNEFYFVFSEPPARRTVIVADDESAMRSMELAAAISPDSPALSAVEFVERSKLSAIAWDDLALLVWQSPVPVGEEVRVVDACVARGGHVVFLPPPHPDDADYHGATWVAWKQPEEPIAVEGWRSDQDLLARTQSGEALPVGDLTVRRYCLLKGDFTPLATLFGGEPLLARVTTGAGGMYFLTTTSAVSDSTLATNGVVLYALIQRALQGGSASLSKSQQVNAGAPADREVAWKQTAGPKTALSSEYPYHSGVYQAGDRTLAVNRSVAEDNVAVLDDGRLEELFQGLDFDRVDERAGSATSLAREVWRLFLFGTIGALIVEAGLCLPKGAKSAGELA